VRPARRTSLEYSVSYGMGPGWKRVLMPKPKTKAQLDRAADIRLQRTYGVGLDWYYEQLGRQNGVCAISGALPGARRLHVDHDHSWKKIKISATSLCGKPSPRWHASATYLGKHFETVDINKRGVVRKLREILKRASVRGLLCYSCNAGLRKFLDIPAYFRAAA